MPEATVAGVRLSKTAQQKLVEAAREAAQSLGFCNETDSVLAAMGFDVPHEAEKMVVYAHFHGDLPVDHQGVILDEVYEELEKEFKSLNITINVKGTNYELNHIEFEVDVY